MLVPRHIHAQALCPVRVNEAGKKGGLWEWDGGSEGPAMVSVGPSYVGGWGGQEGPGQGPRRRDAQDPCWDQGWGVEWQPAQQDRSPVTSPQWRDPRGREGSDLQQQRQQRQPGPAKEAGTGLHQGKLMTPARQLFLMSPTLPQAMRPGRGSRSHRKGGPLGTPENGPAPMRLHPLLPLLEFQKETLYDCGSWKSNQLPRGRQTLRTTRILGQSQVLGV